MIKFRHNDCQWLKPFKTQNPSNDILNDSSENSCTTTKKTIQRKQTISDTTGVQIKWPTILPQLPSSATVFRSAKKIVSSAKGPQPWLHGFDVVQWYSITGRFLTWVWVKTLVPLVNIKIAGKWMFIPLKMVLYNRYWSIPIFNNWKISDIFSPSTSLVSGNSFPKGGPEWSPGHDAPLRHARSIKG